MKLKEETILKLADVGTDVLKTNFLTGTSSKIRKTLFSNKNGTLSQSKVTGFNDCRAKWCLSESPDGSIEILEQPMSSFNEKRVEEKPANADTSDKSILLASDGEENMSADVHFLFSSSKSSSEACQDDAESRSIFTTKVATKPFLQNEFELRNFFQGIDDTQPGTPLSETRSQISLEEVILKDDLTSEKDEPLAEGKPLKVSSDVECTRTVTCENNLLSPVGELSEISSNVQDIDSNTRSKLNSSMIEKRNTLMSLEGTGSQSKQTQDAEGRTPLTLQNNSALPNVKKMRPMTIMNTSVFNFEECSLYPLPPKKKFKNVFTENKQKPLNSKDVEKILLSNKALQQNDSKAEDGSSESSSTDDLESYSKKLVFKDSSQPLVPTTKTNLVDPKSQLLMLTQTSNSLPTSKNKLLLSQAKVGSTQENQRCSSTESTLNLKKVFGHDRRKSTTVRN